jgi:D-aminopeptidase
VSVGHATIDSGAVQTGVTALMPHQGNVFSEKCVAACEVINGFGKSVGLLQLDELGQLETPILLTNTLSVGSVSDTLIKYMLKDNVQIGAQGTVNPLVMECNDGYLNDIRGQHVNQEHTFLALNNTSKNFQQGSIGAGRGMSAYKLKGGIGSSSRVLNIDNKQYTMGALVLSNMGRLEDFCFYSEQLHKRLERLIAQRHSELKGADKGSIIMIIATDLPMDARQLKRLAKRSVAALVRTGSCLGTGSGDICLAFSTANKIKHEQQGIEVITRFSENDIDTAFDCTIEVTEEAIISSMLSSVTVTGYQNNCRVSLSELL